MPILTIDGMMLKDMFLSGAALLAKNRESIDALNVFPVPDGDTGTNMTQTMATAVKELASRTFPTVSDVASTVAKGALKGARGNSGVILSQILRGISRALEGVEEMDAPTFVKALRSGADTAYKAVMKPKEGTILTVARVIAEELEREKTADMLELMRKVLSVGDAILKRTPEMLPVLKQAGVVDSGGKGLMVVYAGFYAALSGEPVVEAAAGEAKAAPLPGEFVDDHESLSEIKFAYCTEFIVSHPKPDLKDSEVARLRKRLERIGDCVLVVGDLEVVKVHVHTNEPGRALQMALELGELDAIKIDNMLEEFRERLAKKPPEPELKDFGMVAVALGAGITEIFRDMAVDQIVDGGQTMNPSIDELVQPSRPPTPGRCSYCPTTPTSSWRPSRPASCPVRRSSWCRRNPCRWALRRPSRSCPTFRARRTPSACARRRSGCTPRPSLTRCATPPSTTGKSTRATSWAWWTTKSSSWATTPPASPRKYCPAW